MKHSALPFSITPTPLDNPSIALFNYPEVYLQPKVGSSLLRRSGGKASMVDFSKLTRPKASSSPINPIEIFKKTPNLGQAPNDLWKGQAEALQQWHDARKKDDNLIIFNTGAGKSIVGVLIAQSLVN